MTWVKLLEILTLKIWSLYLIDLAVWNEVCVVEVLPADDGPLSCMVIWNGGKETSYNSEVVEVIVIDVHLCQLSPVLDFRLSPKELDSHQVWTILCVEGDRYVVGLAPLHDVAMGVNCGIVHEETPLVVSW